MPCAVFFFSSFAKRSSADLDDGDCDSLQTKMSATLRFVTPPQQWNVDSPLAPLVSGLPRRWKIARDVWLGDQVLPNL